MCMSKISLALVLWLKWGAEAVSRFPPAVWCSALGWMSPSDLLDVAPDLGGLDPAQNLAERAALDMLGSRMGFT